MTSKDRAQDLSNILTSIDENSNSILRSVHEEYGLKHGMTKEQTGILYQYLWIFTHGIATLLATGVCEFTEAEVSNILPRHLQDSLPNKL